MISLSTRAKEAIKTSLAIVIVYWIAMQMDWDKPYWAGFTVITINMLSAGVSLTKGITRTLGTLVGAVAGLVFAGLFPQDRWLMMGGMSLFLGFGTYMLTGKNQSYFWFLASFTCLIIIGVSSPPESQSIFQVAVLRTQETALGAVVYILIAAFLWPLRSVEAFNKACCKLWKTQTCLFRAYRDQMSGTGTPTDSRPLRLQEIKLLNQVGQLLNAAESDSSEVWELRRQWRCFHTQSTVLMEAFERWRQSFAELQSLNLIKLLPNLEAVNSELDMRFEQVARMLADEAPTQTAQSITLAVDIAEMRILTRFQEAAVVVTQVQLEHLERLSRSLFDCMAEIRGYPQQSTVPAATTSSKSGFAIDPDRFRAAASVVITLWLAFFLWVYINPPGHSAYVMMAGIFALIIAMAPQASSTLLFLSWGSGIAFAGILYIFVMPHLSTFAEIAGLLFGAFFLMYYLLGVPKTFVMASFLILINIDNQQSYSFSQYANNVLWIMLSLVLAVATTYIPSSPHPEKVFLRLLRRFFRHAEFQIAELATASEQQKGIARRWKKFFYPNDLLVLPPKLMVCSKQIDYRRFPDNTTEQVQALVTSLYALAYRLKDLVEAREYPHVETGNEKVLDDLRAWRQAIEGCFQWQTHDPFLGIEPTVDLRDRLKVHVARLEAHIDETFEKAGENEFSIEDYKNLLRLLGSQRALSEATIGYAQLAADFNWAPWQEARF